MVCGVWRNAAALGVLDHALWDAVEFACDTVYDAITWKMEL
jgi:hypothetical protein